MGSEMVIDFLDVYKTFGNKDVLKGLTFSIEKGEIFALLGHNGAGKTTTLRLMIGLLEKNQGEISVFGKNPIEAEEENRKRMGILAEDVGLYETLTVYENLEFFCKAYNYDIKKYEYKIDEMLTKFDMLEYKYSKIAPFSVGMKKKIALIRALICNPDIVFLDEPTNGLDPISVERFHNIIKTMRDQCNTTFIITTHNLDEVKKICDHIVIVQKGINVLDKNLVKDSLDDITNTKIYLLRPETVHLDQVDEVFSNLGIEYSCGCTRGEILVKTSNKEKIAQIIMDLSKNNISIYQVIQESFDLEKMYIGLEEKQNV